MLSLPFTFRYLLFYGGHISNHKLDNVDWRPIDYTGRGGIYHYYRNHSDYLIVNSGPPDFGKVNFPDAMLVRSAGRVHVEEL